MTQADATLEPRRFGQTARRDTWWLQPAMVLLGLSAFIVYSTWAAFQGEHYHAGPYLSPLFHSRCAGSWRSAPWPLCYRASERCKGTRESLEGARRFGQAGRREALWLQPPVVFVVLSASAVCSAWAAPQGAHDTWGCQGFSGAPAGL